MPDAWALTPDTQPMTQTPRSHRVRLARHGTQATGSRDKRGTRQEETSDLAVGWGGGAVRA